MDLKTPGDLVYLVGPTYAELGGSEYYGTRGFIGRSVPRVRLKDARKTMNRMTRAIDAGCVRACHDLSEGGLAITAAEMAFSGGYGLDIWLSNVPQSKEIQRDDLLLFSESNSRFLVEVPKVRKERFEALMEGAIYSLVGKVRKERSLSVWGLDGGKAVEASLAALMEAWKTPFRA